MDNLVYSQGQTAALYAQFVTSPDGQPIDVPDAMVAIYDINASPILVPTAMTRYDTGFYSYSYVIPFTLTVATYTVKFTGTVSGVMTAAIASLVIVSAGTPTSATLTQRQVAMIIALDSYIGFIQKLPIYNAPTFRDNLTTYRTSWTNWNLSKPIIMQNGTIVDPSQYNIDLDNGIVTFSTARHDTDQISVYYNFRYFLQNDLLQFLGDSLNLINVNPPATNYFIDTIPNNNYLSLTIQGACALALKRLLFDMQFGDPSTIFRNPKESMDQLFKLKENYEKTFNEGADKLKRLGKYPNTVAVSQPALSLPGGRSRIFRYLYSSNAA